MTMMVHIRRVIAKMPAKPSSSGMVFFRGFEKKFDKIELSEDQEVVVMSYEDGPSLVVRITSIDAIEFPNR